MVKIDYKTRAAIERLDPFIDRDLLFIGIGDQLYDVFPDCDYIKTDYDPIRDIMEFEVIDTEIDYFICEEDNIILSDQIFGDFEYRDMVLNELLDLHLSDNRYNGIVEITEYTTKYKLNFADMICYLINDDLDIFIDKIFNSEYDNDISAFESETVGERIK